MNIQVATMTYFGDGETSIHLATTVEKAKEILIAEMREYLKWTDYEDGGAEIPRDWDALQEIGWENEFYTVDINAHTVHSDEHILKYVMETI